MSTVQVNQILSHLNKTFGSIIPMPQTFGRDDESKKKSQMLAAFAVMALADTTKEDAIIAITDDFGDNGIDAIYYDEPFKELFIIQSKFISSGTGEPKQSDIGTFIKGVKDLLELKFERFNDKIKDQSGFITDILSDIGIKVRLVLAFTGSDKISEPSMQIVNDLIEEVNEASNIISFERFSLKAAINALANILSGKPIDETIMIRKWAMIDSPYKAVTGIIDGSTLAELWIGNKKQLLSENIREFIGLSSVNSEMKETAINSPATFFYYNNGITVLCDSVQKSAIGGSSHDAGQFNLKNIRVVNGAQTVGSLAEAYVVNTESVSCISVMIKIISLEDCPEGFGTLVTQKTNTQNKIEKRDFASLDAQHQRLKAEFALMGINYQVRRTSITSENSISCNIEELITAIACSLSNVDISITAKREVGKLWDAVDAAPYTDIINDRLTSYKSWRCILIMRRIAEIVKNKQNEKIGGRITNCYIHSNRLVLHFVLNTIDPSILNDEKYNFESFLNDELDSIIINFETKIFEIIEQDYSNSMIPQLFRNFTKVRDIKSKIIS